MVLFKGCGAATVTPFDAQGNIDYTVLARYIEHLIDGGVSAIIPFGTTGEPATLEPGEYETATRFIVEKVNKRVPVIVGAGSTSTKLAAKHAADAKAYGADAVLVVTPYYNKCTQNGIIEHYLAVAEAGLPVIAYNVPSRTGVNILPETAKRLAAIPGIVGIKEASGNIDQLQAIAAVCAQSGMSLYCGEDSLTFVAYALGAVGTISVAANPAPKLIAELCKLCETNDFAAARALQFKLSELIACLFCEVNPIPAKKAMQLLGFDVGAPRLPLTEMEAAHTARLEKSMREVGLL